MAAKKVKTVVAHAVLKKRAPYELKQLVEPDLATMNGYYKVKTYAVLTALDRNKLARMIHKVKDWAAKHFGDAANATPASFVSLARDIFGREDTKIFHWIATEDEDHIYLTIEVDPFVLWMMSELNVIPTPIRKVLNRDPVQGMKRFLKDYIQSTYKVQSLRVELVEKTRNER